MDELDDILSTTANTFLGVTVGCARCHNHKFDPIPQKDYYRMQAVFFSTRPNDVPLTDTETVRKHGEEEKRIEGEAAPVKKEREALLDPYRKKLIEQER